MAFSSGLVLSDLSDYLAPSQICIKPVEQLPAQSSDADDASVSKEEGGAATEIRMDVDNEVERHGFKASRAPAEVAQQRRETDGKGKGKLQKAQITLNDCLACSGCITSAESVLVSLQSHTEMLAALSSDTSLVPVLSIAPQSLASLSALHSLPPPLVLHSLRRFFKRELGFRLVFDTTFAREVSLLEARREFVERSGYRDKSKEGKGKTKAAESPLPLLASACPGWICYAEKTHGALLPYISRVKSPQQIQGSLVKSSIAARLGVPPEKIYHVAAMMCYDKKLEASRPDFRLRGTEEDRPGWRDVDCVLTTGEVQKILDERGWDVRASTGTPIGGEADEEEMFMPECLPGRGSASGGYLNNILTSIIDSMTKDDWPRLRLSIEPRRGNDYIDYTLYLSPPSPAASDPPPPATPIFKGATCYGFRNLQNLVRKIGRDQNLNLVRGAASSPNSGASTPTSATGKAIGGKSAAAMAAAARRAARRGGSGAATPTEGAAGTAMVERGYDYVEVMACPSGCVNGGGQVPPPLEKWKRDAEGMPIDDGEGEIKMIRGANGNSAPVRSAKEWVQLVERVYWSSVRSATSHRRPEAKLSNEQMPEGVAPIDPSILPLVLPPPEETVDAQTKARELLNGLDAREGGRERFMRTGYRAVESEEVNGLAVKW